ncbi:hypothetical protein ACFU7D_20250 [Nocardioides sp. NPDC057577]|uniref:hypothetical protein n=1 Tax=Nocardioides sp. NPDC057577 TaxID=3346171 RepID=UPI003672D234
MSTEKESHCQSCGDALLPGAVYCIGCGTPLLAPPEQHRPLFVDELGDGETTGRTTRGYFFDDAASPPQARRKGRTAPILVMIVVLVLVAGVLGFIFGKDGIGPVQSEAEPEPSTSPTSEPSSSVDPSAPPERQLLRISRLDTEAATKLIGTWIPQLAAVGAGDGGDADWRQALTRYQKIKTAHPEALLLDTGEWPSSYVKPGMYAVVVPHPSDTSSPALEWCVEQGLSKTDCAAKHLEVSGDPTDNFDAQ